MTALLLEATVAGPARAEVVVRPHEDARRVDIVIDGAPFTSYVWPQRLAKPVLFPLRSARGHLVTRGYPLEPRAGERSDHPHQVGLWLSYGDVDGVDFWNNSEARSQAERSRMGTIRHVAIDEARGGGEGVLSVRLEWLMPDSSLALRETTTYRFRGTSDGRLVDRLTRLTAAGRRVVLGDNKEGLFALRVARGLEEPADRPVPLVDATGEPAATPVLDNRGVGGRYASSEGHTGAAVWGSRGRWLALHGRIEEEDVVLLVMDHPGNPGHPTAWHARGYGLFAANPLGRRAFDERAEPRKLALDPDETRTFRHRLLILSAPFSAEAAEAAWREFAAEPAT